MLKERLPPLELASILAEYLLRRHGDIKKARQSLTWLLQQALYKNSGWQAGALVANIVRLACRFAQLGKPVAIVTSNYDTYVEEEFIRYVRHIESQGAQDIPDSTFKRSLLRGDSVTAGQEETRRA